EEDGQAAGARGRVRRLGDVQVETGLALKAGLLEVGQQARRPAPARTAVPAVRRDASGVARREALRTVVVTGRGQSDLLEVVRAMDASGGLTSGLDGRQEQSDEDANDDDDDQDFNQGEARAVNTNHGAGPHSGSRRGTLRVLLYDTGGHGRAQ